MEKPGQLDVKFQLIEGGIMPRYTYEGDAGLDCYARMEQDLVLLPCHWAYDEDRSRHRLERWCDERQLDPRQLQQAFIYAVPLGIAMELPQGYEAQIRPRSGLSLQGLFCPNSPATIDSGYRGEVHFICANLKAEPFVIRHADRICQMLILPVPRVNLIPSQQLTPSARGTRRFGSSGKE